MAVTGVEDASDGIANCATAHGSPLRPTGHVPHPIGVLAPSPPSYHFQGTSNLNDEHEARRDVPAARTRFLLLEVNWILDIHQYPQSS